MSMFTQNVTKWSCSNQKCVIKFPMVLGYFDALYVFCSISCMKDYEMKNPCKEFGSDSSVYTDVRNREINVACWLANLFDELIQRGIDSDEHHHCKDSPLGNCYAPNLLRILIIK